MEFIDFSAGRAGAHDTADDGHPDTTAHPVHHFAHMAAPYSTDPANPAYLNPTFSSTISCDIKPRLTKEQHDILEAHFQKQHKPNTVTKKGFAATLGVTLDKVNVSDAPPV